MSTYVIGDVQGCYQQLQQLLELIQFDQKQDRLWFCGDLVNRGPESLAVLRFVKSLGDRAIVVLGNHDLHCLAVLLAGLASKKNDTLQEIADANDKNELLFWLKSRPLLHYDPQLAVAMVHAGIPPCWDVATAAAFSREVEQQLQGANYLELLQQMYGNQPDTWDDSLTGIDRYRFIINALTRMRFLEADGRLNLTCKTPAKAATELTPWFDTYPATGDDVPTILFGHWAALGGECSAPKVEALDTGCVWGGELTALCLETWERFSVASSALPNEKV